MNIIFLGGVFAESFESELGKYATEGMQYAANKFQWNIIKGLSSLKKVNVKIISAPFIPTYPRGYKKRTIEEKHYTAFDKYDIFSVGFDNTWGYRNFSRKKSIDKALKESFIEQTKKTVIIVYSLHSPLLQSAIDAKKRNPNIIICCVVPDLPQFMNFSSSLIYKIAKKIDIKIIKDNIRHVDCYVLLTKHMKKALNIKDRPYVIVEGIVNENHYSGNLYSTINNSYNKRIVYTGGINKEYGILTLLEAFVELDNTRCELLICGKGPAVNIVQEYADKYKNIRYLGELNNNEAVKLQSKADILINPRQNIGEYTKYSFPSKNMEYMASGKPTIAYELDGIPKEYRDFLYYVPDNSVYSLAKTLDEVLSWSDQERMLFGEKAREFVINNKGTKQTALQIVNMIKIIDHN